MRQLERFAATGWHNTRTDAALLVKQLRKLHPKFTEERCSRFALHTALYGKKPFRDLWMRQLCTIVLKIAEAYLKTIAMEQHSVMAEVGLMQAYRERGLQKHFDGALRRAQSLQADSAVHDIDHFHRQYLLESERTLMREAQKSRDPEADLQGVANNLDVFYLARKLKLAVQMTTDATIYGREFEQPLVPELLEHLAQQGAPHPLVELYHSALLTLQHPDAEHYFFILKRLLENHQEVLTPEEAADLHTVARNFAIRQANRGRAADFLPELFGLYQLALDRDILLDQQGYMPSSVFKNIVALGLALQHLEWVHHFLTSFGDTLRPAEQADTLNYNQAKLQFAQGSYRDVVRLLRDTEYDNVFVAIDARCLLAKTWYELQELDALESLLDSFATLIRRQQHLGYHAENYLNMIRFTRQLIRIGGTDPKALQALRISVESEPVLTEKTWLLAKIDAAGS